MHDLFLRICSINSQKKQDFPNLKSALTILYKKHILHLKPGTRGSQLLHNHIYPLSQMLSQYHTTLEHGDLLIIIRLGLLRLLKEAPSIIVTIHCPKTSQASKLQKGMVG